MEYNYISIKEILNRVMRHPLMSNLTLDQILYYTLDFFKIFGFPNMYKHSESKVIIEDYRGKLPCDLISIKQVVDCTTGTTLRYMTDTFTTKDDGMSVELSYKTQGNIIYTSFKKGILNISYLSLPVDENGFPLLIDNNIFMKCLELYIKKEYFGIQYDLGKLDISVLNKALRDYSWTAGQLQGEFTIPSVSEMESISRMWTSLVQNVTAFDNHFSTYSNREYLKKH